MTGRGRGGKFGKPKRGGGKHFSRNLRPIGPDGEEQSMWADSAKKGSDDGGDSSESSSEESSSDDGGTLGTAGGANSELTREQRKAEARKRKENAIAKKKAKAAAPGDMPTSSEEDSEEDADDDMPANPNHTAKAQKQAATMPAMTEEGPPKGKKKADVTQLSRREREALQAQQAKDKYQKLHAEGKTDEARADLERLKLVRERRDAEVARKKAEAEERAELEKEKKEQMERMERQEALKANKAKALGNKKKGKT